MPFTPETIDRIIAVIVSVIASVIASVIVSVIVSVFVSFSGIWLLIIFYNVIN